MDVTWLTMILRDLHIMRTSSSRLYCDNISAIALTANLVFHTHTKHIEVNFHFVHEKAQRKELVIYFNPSEF